MEPFWKVSKTQEYFVCWSLALIWKYFNALLFGFIDNHSIVAIKLYFEELIYLQWIRIDIT